MNSTPPSPIRIGIAGSSWWVDSMYLPALQHHPHGRVTAIAGRDAPELAQRWQVETTYPDWQSLLDSGAVDAVIIATRNHTHFPIACAALEAGLHVLCEKPIGLNYREAAALAELAAAKGAITMTPFTYHYMPAARYLEATDR
ncbi:MAG: Gfo/Idh/MocA family oxidoreductase [Anaerolineales bacterium]|nr:Gfo/Idh/MocA family oxidoreductase [Anaerolineales bacterium]